MKKFVVAAVAVFVTAACWVYAQQTPDVSTLPFSPARQAGGTLYLSGQIAVSPEGEQVTESVTAETRQVMKNLGAILKDNGYDWEDVVNVTVYLSSMDHYTEMNAAYREFFDGAYPARACIGGVELAFGFRTEISAIAYKE